MDEVNSFELSIVSYSNDEGSHDKGSCGLGDELVRTIEAIALSSMEILLSDLSITIKGC